MSTTELVVDIQDIEFCLFEWLQVDQLQKYTKYKDFDAETLDLLLKEGLKFAKEVIALSSLWEIAALVKLLGRKGILTRIEVLAMIQELRQREHTGIPPRRLRVEASTPPVDTSQSTAQPAIPASC